MDSGMRPTEQRNPATVDIDLWPSERVVAALLAEDAVAIAAAQEAGPALARAVDASLERIERGGQIRYFGAGASGRLAVLDATEATPTFGTPAGFFRASFPGGTEAFFDSALDHEDAIAAGQSDAADVEPADVAIGLTASGGTGYVAGALRRAGEAGALTILITCNPSPPLAELAEITIVADTGAEAITGSTRLKAGTATKALLNAFSTALMVRQGRTYSNLMVGLTATNNKLEQRAVRVIELATGVDAGTSEAALKASAGDLPLALLHVLTGHQIEQCRQALETAGSVRAAVSLLDSSDHDR